MKEAKNSEEAFEMQNRRRDEPHGCIQWKGTEVCMDVYCECGEHSHVDGWFAYHVKCPKCGAVYSCSGTIEFIKVEEEPDCGIITGE